MTTLRDMPKPLSTGIILATFGIPTGIAMSLAQTTMPDWQGMTASVAIGAATLIPAVRMMMRNLSS